MSIPCARVSRRPPNRPSNAAFSGVHAALAATTNLIDFEVCTFFCSTTYHTGSARFSLHFAHASRDVVRTAMECAWDTELLRQGGQLPEELLQIIQNGSNEQYLEALTKSALDARYTYTLLIHCEDLLAHICASLRTHGSLASSIATLGRIIPYAPFLSSLATHMLEQERYSLGQKDADNEDLLYLLGLFRLVRYDRRIFGRFVPRTELARLLQRSSPAVTYLIIRILQIQLKGADHWFETTLKQYLGEDRPDAPLDGPWDDRIIDYRFLTLWEQERSDAVFTAISKAQRAKESAPSSNIRRIPAECFHSSTTLVGGVLLPTLANGHSDRGSSELVHTLTTSENVSCIAHAQLSGEMLNSCGFPNSRFTDQ